LILGILIVSNLITRVTNPLKKLTKEIDRVKNFDLEGGEQIQSRIKEIAHISAAVDGMKRGLRSFKKYVPAPLVRQLIEAGEDARVGGSKKNNSHTVF